MKHNFLILWLDCAHAVKIFRPKFCETATKENIFIQMDRVCQEIGPFKTFSGSMFTTMNKKEKR